MYYLPASPGDGRNIKQSFLSHPFHATHDCIDLCGISPRSFLFQVEVSSASQTTVPNRKDISAYSSPLEKTRVSLLSAGCSSGKTMGKKSLVRKGAGQEPCIQLLVYHPLPGCRAECHCPWTCLSLLPVEWWCKYFPEVSISSEVGITSMHKSTGYCPEEPGLRPIHNKS